MQQPKWDFWDELYHAARSGRVRQGYDHTPLVGRERLLAKLTRAVDLVAGPNPQGMTQVVQGALDVGKDTILDTLRHRLHSARLHGKTVVVHHCHITDEAITPLGLAALMHRTASAERHFSRSRGLRLLLAMAEARWPRLHPPARRHPTVDENSDLAACLRACAHQWRDETVHVLILKRPRTANGPPPLCKPWRSILRGLHEFGPIARVLPIIQGSPTTALAVGDWGVPLNAHYVHEVECLGYNECQEILNRALDGVGLHWGNVHWRRHLSTLGFSDFTWDTWREHALYTMLGTRHSHTPWELHSILQAMCGRILKHPYRLPRKSNNLAKKMQADYKKWERIYYSQRLYNAHHDAVGIWGAICHALLHRSDQRLPQATVRSLVGELLHIYHSDPVEREVLEERGHTPDGMLSTAFEMGFLHPDRRGGQLLCGPPSVPGARAVLMERFQRRLSRHSAPALEAVDLIALRSKAPAARAAATGVPQQDH